jgi:hypothetical protein
MKVAATRHIREQVFHGTLEMDTHADTIVFGKNFIKLRETGRECSLSPYTDYYQAIESVPIVQAATSWTSSKTGETFILVFNEGLWMADHVSNSLINPNQLRHYGVIVQDNPYSGSPLYMMSPEEEFTIPLEAEGTNILVHTRTPTNRELQTCRHVVLSLLHYWDPQHIRFPEPQRSVEEEVRIYEAQRTVGGIQARGHDNVFGVPDACDSFVSDSEDNSDTTDNLYDLDGLQRRLIKSV